MTESYEYVLIVIPMYERSFRYSDGSLVPPPCINRPVLIYTDGNGRRRVLANQMLTIDLILRFTENRLNEARHAGEGRPIRLPGP